MGKNLTRQRRTADLLDAAEQILLQRGFQQTTMEDVARQAGVSVGTLYNTFPGKEVLYSQVAERIGGAVMDRLASAIQVAEPEEAILDVIRLRLYNFSRDRLFFQPYVLPAHLGVEPRPEQLSPQFNHLYNQYVQAVERVFRRYCKSAGGKHDNAVRMRVYLDGLIVAFMGHWTVAPQSDVVAHAARQIREMLFRVVNTPDAPETLEPSGDRLQRRLTYVSRFDYDRISELVEVVRVFGREEWLSNADMLWAILKKSSIALPQEVPPDVVTMNSRVTLRDSNGEQQVVTLVFPRDVAGTPGAICILDHLGVELFGRRIGDVFSEDSQWATVTYTVELILYQPEAAGDYHL